MCLWLAVLSADALALKVQRRLYNDNNDYLASPVNLRSER